MSSTVPTTTDYTGRQLDVELLQTITVAGGVVPVTPSNVRTEPKLVTGMQKLTQRYALLLLSNVGTTHFDAEQGGDLLKLVFEGYVQDAGKLNFAFSSANTRVVNALYLEDINAAKFGVVPLDEQISGATLLDAQVDRNTATAYLRIQIINRAGLTYVFVVPVTKK